jgi:Zn-dependent protease
MRGQLSLGRIARIPVHLHWSLLVVAALLGIGLAGSVLPGAEPDVSPAVAWAIAGVTIAVFFASILAHELAHALAARRYGVETDAIELWALGGLARLRDEAPSPRADAITAAAGPVTSLLLGGAFIGAAFAASAIGGSALLVAALAWLGIVNGVLALFNLLPGAPLDGGRLVRAWRWHRTGDRLRATDDAARAGQVLGWAVILVGMWLVLNGWGTLFLPLTGLFLLTSAKAEQMSVMAEARLAGVSVRDVTWFGIARAGGDVDAETMLWQRSRLGEAHLVAVESADGAVAGLVTEDQLWQVPEHNRPSVRLGQLAVPMSRIARASADEPLVAALRRTSPLRPLITVWGDGRLIGVVLPDVLARRLRERGIGTAG